MIRLLRQNFNQRYRPAQYHQLLSALDAAAHTHVDFRVAETPCFFPVEFLDQAAAIGAELTYRLVSDREYLRSSLNAIPEMYRVADETSRPHFMTADFGIVRGAGGLELRLVELQAFPSVFAYQFVLSEVYREIYGLDSELDYFLGGHTETSFWKLFSQIILGGHEPENVVLAEIEPQGQKTLPDFLITAERLGIRIVDIAELVREKSPGKLPLLFYRNGGKLVPVHRIYNRTIVDELVRKQVRLAFDYREPLDVEWAGHPNWYFHISKFSIPFLDHPAVPPAVFLKDWLEGKGRDRLPRDRESLILKPLFSFAGQGIQFAPTDADLAAIPESQRGEYLLQERVRFEPVIDTPHGPTQAEIRILYLWPEGGDLDPVLSLVRLGRGKMMGVDHNRNQEWVGASAAFYPPREA